jgi:uncharacterized repeat protein (TIGR03803 family)
VQNTISGDPSLAFSTEIHPFSTKVRFAPAAALLLRFENIFFFKASIMKKMESLLIKPKRSFLLMLFVVAGSFNCFGQQIRTLDYTAPGAYTFTAPPLITSVKVSCWGGGGGGGFGFSSFQYSAGGGGAGGFSAGIIPVVPGNQYTVFVGSGGSGGSGATISVVYNEGYDGHAGEPSSFGPFVAAGGGGGGKGNAMMFNPGGWLPQQSWFLYFWGNGGGPGGDWGYGGENGNSNPIAGAGGGNDPYTIKGDGPYAGGAGGYSSYPGSGAGGVGATPLTMAGNGVTPAGGGGGGCSAFSGGFVNNAIGGMGGNGLVRLEWSCPTFTFSAPPTATRVCLFGESDITVYSNNLPSGWYNVTFALDNFLDHTWTKRMKFNAATGEGTFKCRLDNVTTTSRLVTITSIETEPLIAGDATCSNPMTANNTTNIPVILLAPTISASGPVAFGYPGSVTLSASAGSSYSWSNGANTQSTTVTNTGNYSVMVTDGNGCVASTSQQVTVNSAPFNRLWSMTAFGGSTTPGPYGGYGAIFSMNADGTEYIKRHDFDSISGMRPYGSLIQASDRKFYGMTSKGGTGDGGVIFSFDQYSGTYSRLYDFSPAMGASPQRDLMQAANGLLYGMTNKGGTNDLGVVFSFDPVSLTYTKLLDFTGPNGASPYGSLLQASDGMLYGMTSAGGTSDNGTMFRLDPAGSNYTKLVDFNGLNGRSPYGSLMQASNGLLYGMTQHGGSNYPGTDFGLLFSYDINTGAAVNKVSFGANTSWYGLPEGDLIQATGGLLYGLAGGIFTFDATNEQFQALDLFGLNGPPINAPQGMHGRLLQAGNGRFYGMFESGGGNNGSTFYNGAAYSYDPANLLVYLKNFTAPQTGTGPKYSSFIEAVNHDITVSEVQESVCAGSTMWSGFTVKSDYDAQNVFTAQLSDANGNFANPVTVGTVAGVNPGAMQLTIPYETPGGTGYRIRILGSSPANMSLNVTNAFTVKAVTGAVTGDTTGCGSVTLTATGGQFNIWYGQTDEGLRSHTFTESGIYRVLVWEGNGCSRNFYPEVTVHPIPVATIAGIPEACDTVVLTASGGVSYLWTAGLTPQAAKNSFPFADFGYPSISVAVTDTNGCTASATTGIGVERTPTPAIVAYGDSIICSGDSLTLDVDYTQYRGIYSSTVWTNQNNDTLAEIAPGRISVAETGLYKVVATTSLGCEGTASRLVIVDEPAAPQLTVNSSPPFCAGTAISLSTPDGPGNSYSWNTNTITRTYNLTAANLLNCNLDCGNGMFHSNDGNGALSWLDTSTVDGVVDHVSIQFHIGVICSTLGTHTVALNGTPSSDLLYNVFPHCQCTHNDYKFSRDFAGASYVTGGTNTMTVPTAYIPGWGFGFDSVDNGYYGIVTVTYKQFTGSAIIPASSSVMVSPLATTDYTLTVRDSFGCRTSATQTINVSIPSSNVIAEDSVSSCADSVLIATLPDFTDQFWSNGATGESIYTSSPGWLQVSARDSNSCTASDSVFISNPGAQISSRDTTVCAGTALTFSAVRDNNFSRSFNGTDQYADPAQLLPIANDFSIEFVAKPEKLIQMPAEAQYGNSGTFGQHYVLWPTWSGNGSGAVTDAGMGISFGTNGIAVVEHGSNYMPALLSYEAPFADYTHVVVVYENKQPKLYVNGVLVKTGLVSFMDNVYASLGRGDILPGQQGGIGGGSYGYFEGSIDQFKVWDQPLDAQQVLTRYQDRQMAGSYASYEFNETTGDTAYSNGANAFPATLVNNPASAVVGNYNHFLWSTGDTTSTIDVAPEQSTMYSLTVNDGLTSCTRFRTVNIAEPAHLSTNYMKDSITVCPGSFVVADANTGNAWLWSNGERGSAINITQSGTYFAIITAGGCVDTTDSFTVEFKPMPAVVKIKTVGNDNACAPGKVSFGIDLPFGSTTGFSHQWNRDGVPIPGATDSVYHADSTGSYSLTVSAGSSCIKTSTERPATIKPLPIAGFTLDGPATFCAGGAITMSAVPVAGASYKWLRNDVINAGTGASKAFTVAGDYTLVVTAGGCKDTSETTTITVYDAPPSPKIKVLGPAAICYGSSVSMILDPGVDGLGSSFQWSHNGIPISGAADSIYTASDSGSYALTLTNVNGCMKTSGAKAVAVKQLPVADFTGSGPATFCAGGSVVFTAPSIAGYTYTWLKDGTVKAGTGLSKSIKAAGRYTVVATLAGCTDTSDYSQEVVVHALPIAGIGTTGLTSLCTGDTAMLEATPQVGGYSYSWKNGKIIAATTSVAILPVMESGSYRVVVTDTNNCVSNASAATVAVKVNPIPVASVTAQGSTVIPLDGSLKLKSTPSTGVDWQWLRDDEAITGATGKEYMATQSGDYTVSVTKNGCTGVSPSLTVTKSSLKAEQETLPTVVVNEDRFDFIGYPNPVTGIVTVNIRGIETVDATLQVTGLQGQLLYSRTMTETTVSIDMSVYASGTYLVRYSDKQGRTAALRVVKQ